MTLNVPTRFTPTILAKESSEWGNVGLHEAPVFRGLALQVGDDDAGARGGEHVRRRGAEARSAAGDEERVSFYLPGWG